MAKTKMNAQTRRHFGRGLRVETGFSLDRICILHPSHSSQSSTLTPPLGVAAVYQPLEWPRVKKKKNTLLVRKDQEPNRGLWKQAWERRGGMEMAASGLKEAEGASPCEVEV